MSPDRSPHSSTRESTTNAEDGSPSPPRVVVLGGGFGGAYCAQELEKRLPREAEILLIDKNDYFVFYPLLVEAGTGDLEPRHAVVSIRSFTRRARFRMATVESVDPERQVVAYRVPGDEEPREVAYDHLVVSLGSATLLPDVPGLLEYGWRMKSLADAVALRDRAIEQLEIADATEEVEKRHSLLHFVVVGANFTGVEVAGELLEFLRRAARQYESVSGDECHVTLVEITDRVLRGLDQDLADYAVKQLKRRGVNVRLETTVTAIREDEVTVGEAERMKAGTVIWCAGIQPSPALSQMPFQKDDRGYLLCERDLRLNGFENIWGVGDGAVNLDSDGNPYPPTAQHATRAGVHAARNIARSLRGESTRPFDYPGLGTLASLGCRTAVARVLGIKLSGFLAWFVWRTVYLLKMPGLARKVRVALDWTTQLLFARDHVRLGLARGAARCATKPAEAAAETASPDD